MADLIDRQAAMSAIGAYLRMSALSRTVQNMTSVQDILENLPSAQPDRDIPRKPIEGCSLSWRKKVKEAGCPNCSFFLSHYRFYGEGKRITYCEHCGQAIDWEGWEWDANY